MTIISYIILLDRERGDEDNDFSNTVVLHWFNVLLIAVYILFQIFKPLSWLILIQNNNFIIFNIWLVFPNGKKFTLKFKSYQHKFEKKYSLSATKKIPPFINFSNWENCRNASLAHHDCGSLIISLLYKTLIIFNYLNIVIRTICKTTSSTFWSTYVSHLLVCDRSMEWTYCHCTTL